MAAIRDNAETALTTLLQALDVSAVANTVVRAWRDVSVSSSLPAVVVQAVNVEPHPPFVGGPLWDVSLLVHVVTNAHDDEDQSALEALVEIVSNHLDAITTAQVDAQLTNGATCHGIQLDADLITGPEDTSRQMLSIPVLLALHAVSAPASTLIFPFDSLTEASYTFPNADPTIVAGKRSNAFDFAGVNQVAEVAMTYNTAAFTMALWIKGPDPGDDFVILEKGVNDELMIQPASGAGGLQYINAADPTAESVITTLLDDTWHHLACTYDGTSKRCYLDGVLQHSAAMSAPAGNADALSIGGRESESHYAEITLDDLRIYDRALTADEVLALYNSYS